MRTRWACTECRRSGVVRHRAHDGIYAVLNLIKGAHARWSNDCQLVVGLQRVCIVRVEPEASHA